MKKTIVSIGLLLIISVITSSNVFSQACGTGTFILKNYKGGKISKELISFEFFAIKKELIDPYGNLSFAEDLYTGEIIDDNLFDELHDSNCNVKFDELFEITSNKKNGSFNNGAIELTTIEGAEYPIIIKLSSIEREIFIVAYFLGGCNRTTEIVWGEESFLRDE